jgi:hypothetical protein
MNSDTRLIVFVRKMVPSLSLAFQASRIESGTDLPTSVEA